MFSIVEMDPPFPLLKQARLATKTFRECRPSFSYQGLVQLSKWRGRLQRWRVLPRSFDPLYRSKLRLSLHINGSIYSVLSTKYRNIRRAQRRVRWRRLALSRNNQPPAEIHIRNYCLLNRCTTPSAIISSRFWFPERQPQF